jgi:hypothetical protein
MPLYTDTLESLRNRIRRQRPGISPDLATDFLNERLHTVGDRKQMWAGMLKRGVISIPDSYTTGSITLTTGSTTVTGVGTNWPVDDVVSVTIPTAVRPGDNVCTPSSMSGIGFDTVLFVDASGSPEVVPVMEFSYSQFKAVFNQPHNSPFTATTSSLAGLQLRMGAGSNNPIYSVVAVTSPTTLLLDNPWGGPTQVGVGYEILKIYVSVGQDCREVLQAADMVQQSRLAVHVPQAYLNAVDPNRTSTNDPQCLADLGPSMCGNMQVEVWPPQATARQISILYYKKWPDLRKPSDRPPPFINPTVILYGALADALRTKCPIANGPKGELSDPYYDPQTAMLYEKKFESGVSDAIVADDSYALSSLTSDWSNWPLGSGAGWDQSHAVSAEGEYLSP